MGFRPKRCIVCNVKFTPKSRNNTICENPECKAIRCRLTHEKNRQKQRELRKKNAELQKKAKKIDTLAEADAKARAEGLSYGQRELRIWMEKQRMERRRLNGN